MSFVKLSIFGTSFEVSHNGQDGLIAIRHLTSAKVTTRYVDLQPVGMGGLSWHVWYYIYSEYLLQVPLDSYGRR